VYDYCLGGKSNYIVDRDAAKDVLAVFPTLEVTARANRAWVHRAGRYLARQGARQFVDVGVGMPAAPNVHEVVQAVAPDATVVYTDNDPIVLIYADELEDDSPPEGATRCVEADVKHPEELLTAVEGAGVDFGRPVALGLHALLDFIPDGMQPYAIVDRLLAHLAPRSFTRSTACWSKHVLRPRYCGSSADWTSSIRGLWWRTGGVPNPAAVRASSRTGRSRCMPGWPRRPHRADPSRLLLALGFAQLHTW
jgi:hypothetical protein